MGCCAVYLSCPAGVMGHTTPQQDRAEHLTSLQLVDEVDSCRDCREQVLSAGLPEPENMEASACSTQVSSDWKNRRQR